MPSSSRMRLTARWSSSTTIRRTERARSSIVFRSAIRCAACTVRASLGLSSGVIDGWKFARPESEAVGAMDADFSHDPRVITQMVRALENGYDLAIGSRYVPGGGIENWPWRRKVTSLVAIALAKPLTPIRDITSGFFMVRRSALEGVELDPIGFKIGLEVIAKARYRKAIEVPYVFTDRVAGSSKLNQGEILNYLRQLGRIYRAKLTGGLRR